tara:strand:+ start:43 stop:801 length:759 start_codon:yes stop_codon:yes gene_type:complete
MAGDVATALNQRLQQTRQDIQNLQVLERHQFDNLQKASGNGTETDSSQIQERIKKLVDVRTNLYNKMSNMFSSKLNDVTKARYAVAEQISVTKTMEDELNNVDNELNDLKQEKANKKRLLEISEFEYDRFNEYKEVIKVLVYGGLVILVASFLMKQAWFPPILGVAMIGITAAIVIINIVGRVVDNYKRQDRDFNKMVQSRDNSKFNKELPEGGIPKQINSLGDFLGLSKCPQKSTQNENFEVLGKVQAYNY